MTSIRTQRLPGLQGTPPRAALLKQGWQAGGRVKKGSKMDKGKEWGGMERGMLKKCISHNTAVVTKLP